MKKSLMMAVLILGAASLFAQAGGDGQGGRGQGRGGFGPGGPGLGGTPIEWKAGVSVLQEYKKSTGVVTIGQTLNVTFKADGVEYVLLLPRSANSLLNLKNGDTVTFDGIATTVKGAEVKPTFRVLTATIGGKVIDLQTQIGRGKN